MAPTYRASLLEGIATTVEDFAQALQPLAVVLGSRGAGASQRCPVLESWGSAVGLSLFLFFISSQCGKVCQRKWQSSKVHWLVSKVARLSKTMHAHLATVAACSSSRSIIPLHPTCLPTCLPSTLLPFQHSRASLCAPLSVTETKTDSFGPIRHAE
jgi:hypothetical protein